MAIFQNQGPDLLKVLSLQTPTYDKADLVSGRNEGLRLLPAENNTHSPFSAFGLMNVRGRNRHNIWVVRKQNRLSSRRTVISKSAHTSTYMYVFCAKKPARVRTECAHQRQQRSPPVRLHGPGHSCMATIMSRLQSRSPAQNPHLNSVAWATFCACCQLHRRS